MVAWGASGNFSLVTTIIFGENREFGSLELDTEYYCQPFLIWELCFFRNVFATGLM